ncbi:hypothetical protein [Vibrio sp. T11.5]|uniref:hypothetical protein n=1 Tax=Vibrio sp. T11.5 TaxID=2998836 RepID=UPI0022CD410A|nr:hypothetical protein [Vibrio sp. T11.5]MDA0119690.1 hypothetical protein [Vibrio sp. T11.5]
MRIIALLLLLLITGCSDQVNIKFERSVDQIEEAEFQIKTAIKDIAIVNKFEWEKAPGKLGHNRYVNISVKAKKGIEDYSVDKVIRRLSDSLSAKDPEVTLSVEITETEQPTLDLFGAQTGDVNKAKVDWKSANAGIYYTEGDTSFFGNGASNFYCGIQVRLETTIPVLTYKPEVAAEHKTTSAIALAGLMGIELLGNKKTVDGLPLDDSVYQVQLQTGRHSDDYKYALLIFEYLGKKKVNSNYEWLVSPPQGHSEASCLESIRKKAGSNLYGVAGSISAENNVTSVLKA